VVSSAIAADKLLFNDDELAQTGAVAEPVQHEPALLLPWCQLSWHVTTTRRQFLECVCAGMQRWCTLQHIARLHLHVIGKERLLSVSYNRGTAAVINSSKHDIHTRVAFILVITPVIVANDAVGRLDHFCSTAKIARRFFWLQ
jgi:hypothetical protein